jgi:hypothetical protein
MTTQYKKSLKEDINILGKGTYGCVIPKILKCNKNKLMKL